MRPFLLLKCSHSLLLACACLFVGCTSQRDRSGIETAMKYYDHLIEKLDADSIALLYTEDGNLGNIALGRDSIRNFLRKFKNVRVLSQNSVTKSIQLSNDSALQKGIYKQIDLIDGKDTITVQGEYTAYWQWLPRQGWHIKKMETKPVK